MIVDKRRDVIHTPNGFNGLHLNADEAAELPKDILINSRVYIPGENLPPAAEDIEYCSLHSELTAAVFEHIWEKIASGVALYRDWHAILML